MKKFAAGPANATMIERETRLAQTAGYHRHGFAQPNSGRSEREQQLRESTRCRADQYGAAGSSSVARAARRAIAEISRHPAVRHFMQGNGE